MAYMGRLLLFLFLFTVVATASDEALQTYWKKALPNTKMPGAIKDIIQHVDVKVKGGNINNIVEEKGSEDESSHLECFIRCARSEELAPGLKVTINFVKTTSGLGVSFLPRHSANSIPFSSAKLPDILARFSIKPDSAEAGYIKKTLQECEAPADAAGETKLCATSLESMVEYVTKSLGTRDVATLTTVMDRKEAPSQEYTVSAVKEVTGANFVACHALKYAYALYYCHTSSRTTAYQVSMLGADGTRVEAMVACHMTTCHFLPQDHLIWTAAKK